MRNNATLIYNLCLVAGDLISLIIAGVLAYLFRVKLQLGVDHRQLGPVDSLTFIRLFSALLPFWLFIFALLGLYNNSIYEKRFKEFGLVFTASFIGLLFAVFWNYMASKPIFPARLVPIYAFGFAFLLVVFLRNLARLVRSRLFRYGIGLTKVVVIGNTPMTRELAAWLSPQGSGYRVIGIVGGKQGVPADSTAPLYRTFDEFLDSKPGEFHSIVQTELYADEVRNTRILSYAQEHHLNYRFVPGNNELFVGNIEVELFRSSVPVITIHHTPLFGWGRVIKRISDLLMGGLLFLCSLPLFIIITIALKLSDVRASVFYRPRRLGRFGNEVAILKFRSMKREYTDMSPEEGFIKMGRKDLIEAYRKNGDQLPNDPRVTRIGKLLRATSLDEIPQLWNVVRGDISLVGPRALDPFEMAKYAKRNHILAVKTGLTGLAQVSGRRDISFEERRKLDLFYVQNWSLWLDVTILLKTIRVVLGRKGTN